MFIYREVHRVHINQFYSKLLSHFLFQFASQRCQISSQLSLSLVLMTQTSSMPLSCHFSCVKVRQVQVFLWTRWPRLTFPLMLYSGSLILWTRWAGRKTDGWDTCHVQSPFAENSSPQAVLTPTWRLGKNPFGQLLSSGITTSAFLAFVSGLYCGPACLMVQEPGELENCRKAGSLSLEMIITGLSEKVEKSLVG